MVLQRAGANHKEVNEEEPPIQRRALIQRVVAPTFPVARPAPTRSNSDSSTTKVKDQEFAGTVVKDDAKGVYKYKLDSFTSKGEIQIVYYTDDHYPAPAPEDDAGALSNVTKANWQTIADDLHAKRTGIAGRWSAYRAEVLHEDYHWPNEWVDPFPPELRKAEAAIEKLSTPAMTAGVLGLMKKPIPLAEAENKLKPQAAEIITEMVKTAKKEYFKLGDDPGDPPYIAQAPAVDELETRVRAYGPSLTPPPVTPTVQAPEEVPT